MGIRYTGLFLAKEYVKMALTPEQLAKSGTEDGTHSAIIQACAIHLAPMYPLLELIYHIPNGGSRGNDRKSAQIAGAQMTRLGTKAGTPDMCVPIPRHGYGALYVEVKSPDGKGTLSAAQVDRIKRLTLAGNFCAVVDDWKDGYNLIRNYIFDLTVGSFIYNHATTRVYYHNDAGSFVSVYDPKGYFAKYDAAVEKAKQRKMQRN